MKEPELRYKPDMKAKVLSFDEYKAPWESLTEEEQKAQLLVVDASTLDEEHKIMLFGWHPYKTAVQFAKWARENDMLGINRFNHKPNWWYADMFAVDSGRHIGTFYYDKETDQILLKEVHDSKLNQYKPRHRTKLFKFIFGQ